MRTERQKSKRPAVARAVSLALALCFVFCLAIAFAQAPNNTIKHFRAPLQYHDPPHELQVKSFLEGAQAEPQADGLIVIRDAKLQTFHEDGSREMTVTAPQCIFDSKQQTVQSAGPLQVQTSDDKLILNGEGFFWSETNSDLIVSNRVRTTVRGSLTNSFSP